MPLWDGRFQSIGPEGAAMLFRTTAGTKCARAAQRSMPQGVADRVRQRSFVTAS